MERVILIAHNGSRGAGLRTTAETACATPRPTRRCARRTAWLAFILPLIALVARAQDPVPVLTIDDAVALALRGNPTVQSAALDVDNAKETTAANKTTRLPQFKVYALGGESLVPIKFNIPAGALGTFAATGPIPAHSRSITEPQQFTGFILGQASQPLSQLWKIHLSVLSSKINGKRPIETVLTWSSDA